MCYLYAIARSTCTCNTDTNNNNNYDEYHNNPTSNGECLQYAFGSCSLAMTKPDRPLIAQVMLYSQGFRTAEILAAKIVPFFKLVGCGVCSYMQLVVVF